MLPQQIKCCNHKDPLRPAAIKQALQPHQRHVYVLKVIISCPAVIQQGKIVEQGTYQQLMTKNGAFASLVRHQQQR